MKPVIDVVAGARPNFMKVAPILRALEDSPFSSRLVHTGQHYDEGMSDIFFRQLGIRKPDVSLGVGSGSHGEQTARILSAFEKHLLSMEPRPRGILVVGDVNSTVACTLAAVKLGISVGHVEAGLRSFDRGMPEEINRLVTDAICDLHFVSEPSGEANLLREGVASERIKLVGNVMIDTLVRELVAARELAMASKVGVRSQSFGYVTIHRPSNVDTRERLAKVVTLLQDVARLLPLVFPVHPRTRECLERFELMGQLGGVRTLDPLGYRESLSLMDSSSFILTDSGGIQEEASHLQIPCLTLRFNTERPITVSEGTNTLVGNDLSRVVPLVKEIQAGMYKKGKSISGWDGHASERIVKVLVDTWMDSAGS